MCAAGVQMSSPASTRSASLSVTASPCSRRPRETPLCAPTTPAMPSRGTQRHINGLREGRERKEWEGGRGGRERGGGRVGRIGGEREGGRGERGGAGRREWRRGERREWRGAEREREERRGREGGGEGGEREGGVPGRTARSHVEGCATPFPLPGDLLGNPDDGARFIRCFARIGCSANYMPGLRLTIGRRDRVPFLPSNSSRPPARS